MIINKIFKLSLLLFSNLFGNSPLFFSHIKDEHITLDNHFKKNYYIKYYNTVLIENSIADYMSVFPLFIIDSKINIKDKLKKRKHFIDINNKEKKITFHNIEFREYEYRFFKEEVFIFPYNTIIRFTEEEHELLSKHKIGYLECICKKYGKKFKLINKIKEIYEIHVTCKINDLKIFFEILKIIYDNNYNHCPTMDNNKITVYLHNKKDKKDLSNLIKGERYINITIK